MKTGTLTILRLTDQGYFIPLSDKIIRFDQILLVVAVDGKKIIGMLYDDEVAVAADSIATVDDFTGCGSDDRLTLRR